MSLTLGNFFEFERMNFWGGVRCRVGRKDSVRKQFCCGTFPAFRADPGYLSKERRAALGVRTVVSNFARFISGTHIGRLSCEFFT
jgi:hypothetical protein